MNAQVKPDALEKVETPSFAEALKVWARIGVLSFGGPAAQIALMHREIVDERGWLSEKRFLDALGFCMLLPGPEAMQLATYAGWRLHGTTGGLAAGLLFVLPGACVMLALAALYAAFGSVPLVGALFLGVKAAVVVIVVEALLRVSKRALKHVSEWVIALAAFAGIFFFAIPFPLIVAAAALFGFLRSRDRPGPAEVAARHGRAPARTVMTIAVWLAVWWVPLVAIGLVSPWPVLGEIGLFFSKLAVVTFGGAYAVLAYMAQAVVNDFGWLTAGEMLDGLGLAETTPGPLILVTEFVGYLGAFRDGGFSLGLAGAAVTLWATFAPCFLWIFAGAPYIDWIGSQPKLRGALAAITAAVVGVILNLTIWFSIHVFFTRTNDVRLGPLNLLQPELASLDWRAAVLFVLSAILMFRMHWGVGRVLAVASALGAVTVFFG